MKVAIVLFPGFTALDAIGPAEVLGALPGAVVQIAAEKAGMVTSDTGVLSVAAVGLDDLAPPDVVLVPGGPGTRALATRPNRIVDWLPTVHPTTRFTTSVCTGSLVLGAAGLLRGLEATTHWAVLDLLGHFGAIPVGRRVVTQGRIVTAAGVSAGIDMALYLAAQLAGDEVAKAIQLMIEYDPEPPFDAGWPDKAGPALTAAVKARTLGLEVAS